MNPNEPVLRISMMPDDESLIPLRMNPNDAGYDLFAAESGTVFPGKRCFFRTGVRLELPDGVSGEVLSRSGLARNRGVHVLNAPGLVDPGYRGEIGVTLYNSDRHEGFVVRRGDRIAQLVFREFKTFQLINFPEGLSDTVRGTNGFGSTGQ